MGFSNMLPGHVFFNDSWARGFLKCDLGMGFSKMSLGYGFSKMLPGHGVF